MNCYFCDLPLVEGEPTEWHHPNKNRYPAWVEPAHKSCHRQYHYKRGDHKTLPEELFGRGGYDRAIAKWPAWHRMGGKARAKSARRGPDGRFLPREV